MWRHHAIRLGRSFWRILLLLLLLIVLVSLPILAILGSETGSRWVLEQGLGVQKTLTMRYQSGTFLGGLELADVHLKTSKLDLQIRHVLARWSLLQLLRAEIQLEQLQVQGASLHLLTPPTHQPTHLPILVIPVRVVLHDVRLEQAELWSYGATRPQTLDRLTLKGYWVGARLRLHDLQADQAVIGHLQLKGSVRMIGNYPVEATGRLTYKPFQAQGWQPVDLQLSKEIANLDVKLASKGPLTATASGHIQPLLPDLPYRARLQWQPLSLPWWPEQALASRGGNLEVTGDKHGLRALGQAQLSGKQLPPGQYEVKGATNWQSATIDYFKFNGLGGKLQASGDVNWHEGIAWKLSAQLQQIDLARQWPVPRMALPVLTGKLESKGRATAKGSEVTASARLAGGESWDVQEKGNSWLWDLKSAQQVQARWSNVARDVPGLESLRSGKGALDFKGSLKDYRLTLGTDLQSPRLPAGQWAGEISGGDRHINIEHLDYNGDAGHLNVAGELDVGPVLSWQGALVLGDFSTAWLSENWSGQFTGHLTGRGQWGQQVREIHIEESHLTGSLREQPLLVDGPVDVRLPEGHWPEVWSHGLKAAWGENEVQATGGLRAGQWDLQSRLQLRNVTALVPQLQGSVQGTLALKGEERLPDVQADLSGERFGVPALRAHDFSLQAEMLRLGEAQSQITLHANGMTTAGGASYGAVNATLAGTREAHHLQWQAGDEQLKANGTLTGGLNAETFDWKGALETGQVVLPSMTWQQDQPAAMAWSQTSHQLQLAPHCWSSAEAHLCSKEEMLVGPVGKIDLSLEGLRAERLASLMPEGLRVTGLIAGGVRGGWREGEHPALTGELHADKGELQLTRDEPLPPLVLGYDRVALTLEAAEQLHLQFDLVSADIGQGRMLAELNPYDETRALSGTVSLKGLRLDVFQPFFPALSTLAGAVSADGRLQGTLRQPEFWGSVQLADGEVALHQLPVHIHDINSRIDVKGNAADINGSMKSGEGTANLTGHADWAEQPRLTLGLKGERFELRQQPQLLAEIDPDLNLVVVPGQIDLTGTVRVPMGRLNLKPLTDKAVPLSSDVRIVSTEEGERARIVSATQNWVVNADISVLLGDDVFFHGYGVNGRLMGGLRLRQQGKRGLEANGEVELDKDSRYDAYGQRLQIRRGRLIFAGNLTQPGLDVEAVREIDSKVVGVRVEGRANAPEATLFSDTAMSQEEIISYLVLGRPLDTSGKAEGGNGNLAAAAAAIKLGATGGAGLTTQIGETLGITDLAVDAEGSGDDTQFTVSGYLSPKLYLRYGVGIFTPVNSATIRYKINAKLYLEAVSSLENAIDLFYNLRF